MSQGSWEGKVHLKVCEGNMFVCHNATCMYYRGLTFLQCLLSNVSPSCKRERTQNCNVCEGNMFVCHNATCITEARLFSNVFCQMCPKIVSLRGCKIVTFVSGICVSVTRLHVLQRQPPIHVILLTSRWIHPRKPFVDYNI